MLDTQHGCFQTYKNTPKSSILIGFSIINHPFWDTPSFGNTQHGHTNAQPGFFPGSAGSARARRGRSGTDLSFGDGSLSGDILVIYLGISGNGRKCADFFCSANVGFFLGGGMNTASINLFD